MSSLWEVLVVLSLASALPQSRAVSSILASNVDCLIKLAPGTAPSTLSLIIVGLVVLFCGGIYEVRTKRDALFPVTAFKDPTASELSGNHLKQRR